MNKRVGLIILTVILSAIFLNSCNSCNRDKDKKHSIKKSQLKEIQEQIKISVERYEQDLFKIRKENFEEDLLVVQKKYPFFLEGDLKDVRNQKQLWDYINDPLIKEVYLQTQKVFPDLNELTKNLHESMSYYKTYFPNENIPRICTYVSGFDYELPIKYMDSLLIVAMDMYLGTNSKYYDQLGIPKYVSFHYNPEFIVPDCFKEIAYRHLPNPKTRITLLDYMIFEGKKLYFTECMMPDVPDSLIIGYPKSKIEWAQANEGNIWAYLIENNLLYSKDNKAIVKFINDAPFTSVFAKESPGRIGMWVGWQIVRSYMSANDVLLPDMMKDGDFRAILEKSKYKPKKSKS